MTLAKKSLGQHFLRNPAILAKIVAAAELAQSDTVLEVGPGEGTLTELLLQRAGKVIAIEKDDRLIPLLEEKFKGAVAAGTLELIHADILHQGSILMAGNYKIVANLPYYITGAFLRQFLGGEHQPASMTLLLQKEVARRIVAHDKKESILSISVKCYGEPRIVGIVKAGSFSPAPRVDSAILAIENISKEFFQNTYQKNPPPTPSFIKEGERGWISPEITEKLFFEILKQGFAHPRKLLASNLGVESVVLEECGVPAKARAEDISLEEWKKITTYLNRSR